MAFPSRLPLLRDIPFQKLLSLVAIQSIAIILDSDIVSRQVLSALGFGECEVNQWCDRFKRPVFEALMAHRLRVKTLHDLYRVLSSTSQTEALQKLYTFLREDLNHLNVPEEATSANWEILLNSTQQEYEISTTKVYMRTYIFPTFDCVVEFVYNVFLCSYASDMYRFISNVINTGSIIFWFLTLAQNAIAIYQERRCDNLVPIAISISFWVKLYLINEPLNELKKILPWGNGDQEKLLRANLLYKQIRFALRCVFFYKLSLAMFGCALFYAFPEFLLENMQSQMTKAAFFFLLLELAHNTFYLVEFYWDANIFGIINDLF